MKNRLKNQLFQGLESCVIRRVISFFGQIMPIYDKSSIFYKHTMVSNTFKIISVLLMIITGAFDTLGRRKQIILSPIHAGYKNLNQVGTLFLGQTLALFIFFACKYFNKKTFQRNKQIAEKQGREVKFNRFLIAVSSLCGCTLSTLQFIALNFVDSSVYQMMRGGSIATTFIFSILLLKIKVKRYQVVGSLLAIIGVAVVGISAIAFSDSPSESSNSNFRNASVSTQIAGYFMIAASLVFSGFYFVYQQFLFTKYHIQALQFVGFQGIFGIIFVSIIVNIFSFIPCGFATNACAINSSGDYFLQSPHQYFKSIGNYPFLLSFAILGIFSIFAYNISGAIVAKHISGLARSIFDVCRTILIWVVGIVVTATAGRSQSIYKWESLNIGRIFVQIAGFLMLVAGNLVYSNLIKITCLQSKRKDSSALLQESRQNQNLVVSKMSIY